jgi:hypothetical protein
MRNISKLDASNIHVLPVEGDPKSLLQLSRDQLNDLRAPLLQPFHSDFMAPNRVALYLFRDGSWVVENFNDEAVNLDLNHHPVQVQARGWVQCWTTP